MSALNLSFNCLGFELHDEDRFIAQYRATEKLPRTDAPKPCFAPIYTPSGGLITEFRPADHTWHTGLYYGWVHVNDANLWGGGWYMPESGRYEDIAGSHGMAMAISPYTGRFLGAVEMPDGVSVPPVIAGGSIYFLADDAELVVYR